MGEQYSRSGTLSSTIYYMAKKSPDRGSAGFGSWLANQIRARGMNQAEFAIALGVGTSTVSRWVNGRVPEAALLEKIADVLIVDYDVVATKAGYRPKELLQVDPNSPEARLLPLIRQVPWDERQLRMFEEQLRILIKGLRGEYFTSEESNDR
jgi:transcriptional regulator with XRE-family HTH domain